MPVKSAISSTLIWFSNPCAIPDYRQGLHAGNLRTGNGPGLTNGLH